MHGITSSALLFSLALWSALRKHNSQSQYLIAAAQGDTPVSIGFAVQGLAILTVLGWVVTTLAGRWVAYADYLFWPG